MHTRAQLTCTRVHVDPLYDMRACCNTLLKTTRFESNFSNVSAASTIATFLENKISTLKGFVRVSSGSTSALHQVLVAHDSTDSHSVQYPFLSIGSTSGIGTFSSTLVGNDLNLNFHPDPLYTG